VLPSCCQNDALTKQLRLMTEEVEMIVEQRGEDPRRREAKRHSYVSDDSDDY
jgi:hypothetical protein